MNTNSPVDKVCIIAKTSVGMVRSNNEDYHGFSTNIKNKEWRFYEKAEYLPNDLPAVLVLADGMGGMENGEEASRIAIETIKNFAFDNPKLVANNEEKLSQTFIDVFAKANQAILDFATKTNSLGAMGTTLVVALVFKTKTYIYWIGDSRAYLFRNGVLMPLTKDHSYVQELVDAGKITYEQAFYHPESNIITKFMGDYKKNPVPSAISYDNNDGDILLLCSDGLNGMLQDSEIQNHFYNKSNIDDICDTLITKANEAGGNDNNTVMLAGFGDYMNCIPEKMPLKERPEINIKQITNKAKQKRKSSLKNYIILLLIGLICGMLIMFYVNKLYFTKETKHEINAPTNKNSQQDVNTTESSPKPIDTVENVDEPDFQVVNSNTNNIQIVELPLQIENILKEIVSKISPIEHKTEKDNLILSSVNQILNQKTTINNSEEIRFDNKSEMITTLQKLIDKLKNADTYYRDKAEEIENEIRNL